MVRVKSSLLSSIPKVEIYPYPPKTRYWNKVSCSATRFSNPNSALQRTAGCKHKARYLINGIPMCEYHAGQAVISALVNFAASKVTKDA
jgi:hypothetical protein